MKSQVMSLAWKIAKEVMHEVGAYYGIEVIADGDSIGTYYIAEKVWDAA